MNVLTSSDQSKVSGKIVVVVAHPDDEALWAGGLIYGFSRFDRLKIYVICLSGGTLNARRELEFHQARRVAGYEAGVVLGGALRSASEPLPPTSMTVDEGLHRLEIKKEDIDVLITHSPFGDEHMHPHHMQSCEELYEWTRREGVSFGYFSCLPLPNGRLLPMLRSLKRHRTLQLLNLSWCSYGLLHRLFKHYEKKPWRYPRFYSQWQVDAGAKRQMLECYESINLEQHRDGYASFDCNVESVYLFDDRGIELFSAVAKEMTAPGAQNFFPGVWTNSDLLFRLKNKFLMWGR